MEWGTVYRRGLKISNFFLASVQLISCGWGHFEPSGRQRLFDGGTGYSLIQPGYPLIQAGYTKTEETEERKYASMLGTQVC